jgi:hypothetical protein
MDINYLIAAAALASALSLTPAYSQTTSSDEAPTPGFNNKIPDKILTPDKVETRIGTRRWGAYG